MPLILPGNVATATASTGYDVANSCRFNDGDSAYMRLTPGSAATSSRKMTASFWCKRGSLGITGRIFSADTSGSNNNRDSLFFNSDDELWLYIDNGQASNLKTIRVFRDPSAWYHIVLAIDTTQSTNTDRVKIYINGVQETSFSSSGDGIVYPDQNYDVLGYGQNGREATIGADTDNGNSDNEWDGYLAEFVFIDGLQLAPTSFGEFDEDSPRIWKPKDVSGLTFGTNGFYLDFEDSSNLGNDANGGTDWTETNLAATDQTTDTCTNNFATMNSLVKGNTASTFSEGNLKVAAGGGWGHAVGNIGVAHGKWYWEVDEINANNNAFFGICNELNLGHLDGDSTPYSEAGLMLYFYDGRRTIDGTDSEGEYNAWGTTHGFALDLDSDPRTIKFYKDGSLEATENLTANFPAGEFVFPIFMGSASSNTASVEFNFGNPVTALASGNADANGYGSFEFSPPSGYIAICTKNLGSDGG